MVDGQRSAARSGRRGFELEVAIARSPGAVWTVVADLARTPEWRTSVASVDPPDRLAVGERFAATTKVLGRSWRWVLELVEVEPERRLAYRVVDGVAALTVAYDIAPTTEGSRFTLSGHAEPGRLVSGVLAPLAARTLRRATIDHLHHLRVLLEQPSP